MKLPVEFLQLPLAFDAAALAAEVAQIEESSWRPHPNGLPGNDALTLITTHGDADSDEIRGPMRPTPHLQRLPYLRQVLGAIGATWGRTRLMRLSGMAEVSPHVDVNYYWRERVRLHVPILTQPTVRFSCGDKEINMAAGECWIFDTWRMHRVLNDAHLPRIHLVADTVGGEVFWNHVEAAQPAGQAIPGWRSRLIAPDPAAAPVLDFESVNLPAVMTPWEMREHIAFTLGEAEPHPGLPAVRQTLTCLLRNWHGLWSCYGESAEGWPRYQQQLDQAAKTLQVQAADIHLRNGVVLFKALAASVLAVAVADSAPAIATM